MIELFNLINIMLFISFVLVFMRVAEEKQENNIQKSKFICVKIGLKYVYGSQENLYIVGDDPWKLYKTIDNDPLSFVKKYINSERLFDVVEIEVFEDKNKISYIPLQN